MNNEIISHILKSLAVNFPIIKSWGISAPFIITLLVPPGRTNNVISALRIFNVEQRSSLNSDFVFHTALNHQIANKLAEERIEIIKMDQRGFLGLDIIITEDEITSDPCKIKFYIPFSVDNLEEAFSIDEFVPNPEEIETIRNRFIKYTQENKTSVFEEPFLAAAFLFEPFLLKRGYPEFSEVLNQIEELISFDEDIRETNDIPNLFIDYLYRFIESGSIPSFYPRNNENKLDLVPNFSTESIETALFYDSSCFYISERLFSLICKPLTQHLSEPFIKQALSEVGILLTEPNAKSYTVKALIYDQTNNFARPRLLRFSLESVNRTGELALLDTLKNYIK